MPTLDRRIDAYIAKAAPFAQSILKELRAAVHAGCSDVVETMKWSTPSFEYKGVLCGMAAFKKHAMFGFWKHQLLADLLPKGDQSAFGRFGELTSVMDLPIRAAIVKIVKAAARLNEEGAKVPRPVRAKRPPVRTPPFFMAALKKNPQALANYEAFSPSHKREYVEYLTEAKQDDTRQRRLKTAIEWIADGKARNWKYER